ncbi:glycosyltransferase family 4 protein [Candidatus Woesearchaeota archaeon]|nr:glycosyltransferase family 4 protein [Candidatus Woesearchaeota archaeon]
MKICFVNPTKILRRPIVVLCRLLADKGHKVSLMFPNDVKDPLKGLYYLKLLNHPNINLIKIPSFYIPSLRYALPNPFRIIRESWKILNQHDIVHIWEYYYPYSSVPVLLNIFKGKPVIITTDGFLGYSTLFESKKLRMFAKAYTQLFARWSLFKLCKRFTVYGNPLVPFARKLGINNKRLRALSTGIDVSKFENVPNRIRDEFIFKDEVFILTISALYDRKRVDVFIKTIIKLLNNGYNVKAVIVSDGHLRNWLEGLVPSHYKDKIVFAGSRTDVPAFVNACDIMCLTSLGEGLPGVIMEAAASGKPSVATNEGCTADIVLHGKTGFLAEPFKLGQYYDYIVKLVEDKNLRERMGLAAKEHIKRFDWSNVLHNYEKMYSELLS